MERTGEVADGELGILADVDDGAARLGGGDKPGVADGQPGSGPRRRAPGQLSGETLIADLVRLADHLRAGLAGAEDEDGRPAGVDQPAEPGGELVAQRDRQRARDVT